jgi:hypothetical protein
VNVNITRYRGWLASAELLHIIDRGAKLREERLSLRVRRWRGLGLPARGPLASVVALPARKVGVFAIAQLALVVGESLAGMVALPGLSLSSQLARAPALCAIP